MKTRTIFCSFGLLALTSGLTHAAPLGTAFTYQGRLDWNGLPATNGIYSMRFALYDAQAPGGSLVGDTNQLAVPVTNGLFTADLDFGAAAFVGEARWLETAVSTNNTQSFTILLPRVRVAPTPNAIYASLSGTALTATNVASGTVTAAGLATDSAPSAGQVLGFDGDSLVWQTAGSGSSPWLLNAANTYFTGGNVGIGTATPGVPLHLNSSASGSTVLAALLQPGLPASGFNQMYLGRTGSGNGCGTFTYTYDAATPANSVLSLGLYNSSFTFNIRGNGNVGIGTQNPQTRLHVNGPILSGLNNTLNGSLASLGGGEGNQVSADYGVIGGGINNQVTGAGSGTVGGGTGNTASGDAATVPGGYANVAQGRSSLAAGNAARALHDGSFVWADRQGTVFNPTPFESTTSNQFNVRASGGVRLDTRFTEVVGGGNERAYLGGDGIGNDIQVGSLNPTVTDIFMYNAANGTHMHTHVGVLTIHGGADLAEPFPMKEEQIEKGEVVVIDDEHPGRLQRSTRAYDTRVAGILSGANGVKPGIALKQQGVLDQGENVALTGRVYVQADASFGAIKPGDLLTTSDTPGHAMKVADHARAQGAILGKAMSSLSGGKGLVLVLVTLQ